MAEFLQILGGTTVVLGGLFWFLGKVAINRLLEAERKATAESLANLQQQLNLQHQRLDAKLEKAVHIGKVQFEHEFMIYKDIWKQLVNLKIATLSLRPTMDSIDKNESKEERMEKRSRVFAERFYAFRDAIEENKPFYSPNVYEALISVSNLSYEELIGYQYHEREHSEYWKEARANQENIISQIENACVKIRCRFEEVEIK